MTVITIIAPGTRRHQLQGENEMSDIIQTCTHISHTHSLSSRLTSCAPGFTFIAAIATATNTLIEKLTYDVLRAAEELATHCVEDAN